MIQLRTMTQHDIDLGMDLKTQAKWNQTRTDWERALLLEPAGCFVAEWDGEPVGTTSTCRFDRVGWIAMVLVEERYRGRGIAKALMNRAIEYLETAKCDTIRLDATALGEPVYRKLGFEEDYSLVRLQGRVPQIDPSRDIVVSSWPLEQIIARDRHISGTNRERLMRCLAREPSTLCYCQIGSREAISALAIRDGANAKQLGPCLSNEVENPTALLDAVLSKFTDQSVFVDVPIQNHHARHYFESLGLSEQRSFLRMTRGCRLKERVDLLWASFGPEKG